jgi:hypothetical protein
VGSPANLIWPAVVLALLIIGGAIVWSRYNAPKPVETTPFLPPAMVLPIEPLLVVPISPPLPGEPSVGEGPFPTQPQPVMPPYVEPPTQYIPPPVVVSPSDIAPSVFVSPSDI